MSEAYTRFYSEYKNKLYSYLVSRSGDAELARDIMQESFARHFKHYGKAAVASPALLFTIARNTLVDHQRNQNRLRLFGKAADPPVVDEETSFIAREASAKLLHAMKDLPEQDREILTLAVNGVAYKEIGEICELSASNVKVRVHRARTRLRQMIASEGK